MREKLTVIKVGGKIVEEEATLLQLLNDFAAISGHKVLVHGGGRSATKIAAQLGIESKMVNGRRITDAETLKVVTMVYGGLVNKNIVAGLQARGVNALGLTGADMNVIPEITRAEFEQYVADGVIQGGMIPKLENSFEAINAGVTEVVITLASAIKDNEGTRIKK